MTQLIKKINSNGYQDKTARLTLSVLFLVISVLALVFSVSPAIAATTTMEHTAPDYFISNHRIRLAAQVEDPAGVKLVRCYFKAAGEANLVFVPMNTTGKNNYAGVLPAPSASTDKIEYLFLGVNNSKQVVRSQTFTISKDKNQEPPAWQEVPQGDIKVSMELDKVPTQLRGFSDSVTIDAVESGARFGVVALLYHNAASSSTKSALAANSATGATSGGTITAESAGWSTTAIVAAGVGAAAVVGVAAASGGGGGGGGSDNNNDNDDNGGDSDEGLTETTILGDWNFSGKRRDGESRTGNFSFYGGGDGFSATIVDADGQSDGTYYGSWALSGNNLTIDFSGISDWIGTVSGNSQKFTLDTSSGTNHGTYEFTR